MQAFAEPIVNVEWHNRNHVSYLLKSKLYIYRDKVVAHKFDIGQFKFENEFAIKNEHQISINQKIFDIHFSEISKEVIRVACLSPIKTQPKEGEDQLKNEVTELKIYIKSMPLWMEDQEQVIEPCWPVSQIKMDRTGKMLVVLSQDGMFVFVYTLLNFKGNDKPI